MICNSDYGKRKLSPTLKARLFACLDLLFVNDVPGNDDVNSNLDTSKLMKPILANSQQGGLCCEG